MKKILLLFLFFISFFNFSLLSTTYAETLQEKLENRLNWNTVSKWNVTDVSLEFQFETLEWKELPLKTIILWKWEKWSTYWYKTTNWILSLDWFEKKIPEGELTWTLEIRSLNNSTTKLKENYSIPLNYSLFDWTSSERRQLYYLQFQYDSDSRSYELINYYTQSEKEKDEQKVEIKEVYIQWKIIWSYSNVDIWLYSSEWKKIYWWGSNSNWEFKIYLENYKDRLKLNETYNLIWWKDWSVYENIIWLLYTWKSYTFKNYRDVETTFKNDLKLSIEINNKDIIEKEPLPIFFIFILVLVYFLFLGIVFIKVVLKIFKHPFESMKKEYIFQNRKTKIKDLKSKFKNWELKIEKI